MNSVKSSKFRIGMIGLLLLGIFSYVGAGCRKKALPSAPVKVQDSFSHVETESLTHSYDEILDSGGNIVRGLKPEFFAVFATHIITRVSRDGSVPGTEPIEIRNRGAITKGDTAWKVTITKGGLSGYAPIFQYNFYLDPDYQDGQGYDEFGNPDQTYGRPACWGDRTTPKEITSNPSPSGGPYYIHNPSRGQDWSQYSHFQADVWSDPEEPFWDGGWYLNNNLIVNNSVSSPDLWTAENIQADDREPGVVPLFFPYFPYGFYWMFAETVAEATFVPGLNTTTWKFNRAITRSDATGLFSGPKRWTRLGGITQFFFGIYGAKQGFQEGRSFFVDNPRVVRTEKPPWEGNMDASAFAEHSKSRAEVPSSAIGSGTWTPVTGPAVTYSNVAISWTGIDFPQEIPLNDPPENVIATLLADEGETLKMVGNVCLDTGPIPYPDPARPTPLKIGVRYRMADPKMRLLLDYSDLAAPDSGLISAGPIVIEPGNIAWNEYTYTIPGSESWGITKMDDLRVLIVAKDPAGASIPYVEIDHVWIDFQPCGIYCYHPYSPYYDDWPSWRK